jgi:hypothetical protein
MEGKGLTAEMFKCCALCGKASIILESETLWNVCKYDIIHSNDETEQIEEGFELCPGCNHKTEEEELAEFGGICYHCWDDAVKQEMEDRRHPDDKQII